MIPVGAYDWRVTRVTVGATGAQLAKANPARVLLALAVDPAGSQLSVFAGLPELVNGISFISPGGYQEWFWERHGSLVVSDWSGQVAAGSTAVRVLEVWELPEGEPCSKTGND